jgi:hypothetical protein
MANIENREVVVNTLTSRVIENAPLRELIRVYSEAVQAARSLKPVTPTFWKPSLWKFRRLLRPLKSPPESQFLPEGSTPYSAF